jgi:anti-sigma factor RsiW
VDCILSSEPEQIAQIEGDLVPFHFGTLDEAARAQVEAHLGRCPRCLTAYFEVKRAIEVRPELQPRPSDVSRARLREKVAAELGRGRRPTRLVGAVAAIALLCGTGLGLYVGRRPLPLSSPTGAGPAETVTLPSTTIETGTIDTARPITAEPRFL